MYAKLDIFLRKQRKRVFENRLLRRTFGPKTVAVTGDWRRWAG
jgi:hypothetical protein